MSKTYDSELIKKMRNREIRLDRERNFWSEEEREKLAQMYSNGVDITEMALDLARTELAVIEQLNYLNLLYQSGSDRKHRSRKRRSCLCVKCDIGPDNCSYRANNTEKEAIKSCSKSMQM